MGPAFKTSFTSQSAIGKNLEWASKAKESAREVGKSKDSKSFMAYMKEGISAVNEIQSTADKMSTNLATGKQENIHETMLAISQAEIGFKLMVQIRNKALEAYQEIMRMQV